MNHRVIRPVSRKIGIFTVYSQVILLTGSQARRSTNWVHIPCVQQWVQLRRLKRFNSRWRYYGWKSIEFRSPDGGSAISEKVSSVFENMKQNFYLFLIYWIKLTYGMHHMISCNDAGWFGSLNISPELQFWRKLFRPYQCTQILK